MSKRIVRDEAWMIDKLKETIARLTVNLEKRQILDIHLYEKNLRFKCKRCAVYCCKLGGPSLTKKDMEQLESIGCDVSECIESSEREYGAFPSTSNVIKSKKDDSCVFLRKHKKNGIYECTIYDARPILCRLYPFDLKRTSVNSFLLGVIPCCKGLNSSDGELVNARFIEKNLLENLYWKDIAIITETK